MKLLSARGGLLRLLVPLAVVAVVAGGVAFATASRSDSATPDLPAVTAQQLLTEVGQAKVPGLSGTVVSTSRLGLPSLPSLDSGGVSLTDLASGSHTVRVWLKGEDQSRLALTGQLAESDAIHNGRDVWLYSSEQNSVVHYRLASPAVPPPAPPSGATPQALASRLLAAINPSTTVTVERNLRVAGRDAYQLRLRPKAPESLIDSAVLAVDGQTKVPLRVQMLAKGRQDPAFEVGFTQVQFRAPSDDVFQFTPPPGAKVTEKQLPTGEQHGNGQPQVPAPSQSPRVLGDSWTSVLVVDGVDLGSGGSGSDARVLRELLGAATPVQGTFGQGRVLRTTLLTVLLTDNGRLYAGAVTPQALEAAAARPLSDAKPLRTGR